MKHKFKVIPKEEVLANRSNAYEFINLDKQETLEEAAHEYFKRGQLGFEKAADTEMAFIKGAKWQQEQDKNKYSEEDLEVAYFEGKEGLYSFSEWFEQFKKK